jgi:hypothetical protein
MPWGNSSVRSTSALVYQSRHARSSRSKVLLYAVDFRFWRFPPFCFGSLRDDQLRVAGKVVEDVTRISCKRVAADAKNRKAQKSGEVSHRWLHDPARSNLLNSNPILHLATSFFFTKPFKLFP